MDSAGRQVEVPARIERVIAAGPPASVLMTMLAPEKLIGWNRKPPPEELSYLFRRSCGACRKSAASPGAAIRPTSKS